MSTKKTYLLLLHRLKLDAWLYHYEVIVVRRNIVHLLARVASRSAAERKVAGTHRQLEVSRQAFRIRRARGFHPWNVAKLFILPLALALLLPWPWLSGSIALVCIAFVCGLLTSGSQWMRGGKDDR